MATASSAVGRPPLDLPAIRTYLVDEGLDVVGELSATLIAGGRSNLTFVVRDDRQRWVVRRPPTGGATPSAHDVAREFRVARALENTGVPVARTIALCEDLSVIGAPFTVVEYVEGRTIRTQEDLEGLADDQIDDCVDGLVDALVTLHAVDHVRVGLSTFGREGEYPARQLRRWSSQWEIVSEGRREPAATELRQKLEGLIPAQPRSAIVHGDYRIDNTLVADDAPGQIRAIVDWELSTIGDPVADVALMCAYRHDGLDLLLGTKAAWTSERLPDGDGLAARYEAASGSRLEHWDFYKALAYYKLAVIAEGIMHRYRAGAATEGSAAAGSAVVSYLETGLEQL